MPEDDIAVGVCFVVSIDDVNLGAFNSCEGLGAEIEIEQRREGGNNTMIWHLPTRVKYSNVKLTRPIRAESAKLMQWFIASVGGHKQCTATIEARTLHGDKVASWGLLDVIPVRWTGPSLGPDNLKPAMETLELAHHGFFGPGTGS
ncbi:phage tail protein [Amycolatopsis taiwanensis]|uniref:Phage tail protein n=1 Tax=Amycolatopsis taiwanensis TaxID=342230 RepID=A0A9W6R3Y7_9PSEU|nr:phage tail protein [Amycolatopsis taiwanensis]GLY69049.1 phage tail protein [Amycolatopsis taiwanensis]